MSRILVTGAAGFLGRPLVMKLRSAGHQVTETDVPQGDITLEETLNPFLEKKIEHVFHLAGKTFVPESWQRPFGFYHVNVLGTVNVLEFCRKTGAGLTYVSSYLYGQPDYLPIDETHPVKAYNPYSHSKVEAENICRFFAEAYGLKILILRPFNAYGPGQSSRFIIPDIIEMTLNPHLPVVEVVDLRPRRDYIFVDDLVDAFLKTLQAQPGIYNLGSGYSVSVEEIISLASDLTGIKKEYRARGPERTNEIFDLYADVSKAGKELNWSPETSFKTGLETCIRSFSKH